MSSVRWLICCACVLLGCIELAMAAPNERAALKALGWEQTLELDAAGLAEKLELGGAMATAGDLALIGAPPGKGRAKTGAAYFMQRSKAGAWTLRQTFRSETGEDERLGASVALDGDFALIGAPGREEAAGAVYVLQHKGDRWQSVATLRAKGESRQFGRTVLLQGHLAVIASFDQVHLFERDRGGEWSSIQVLRPPPPQTRAVGGLVSVLEDHECEAGPLAEGSRFGRHLALQGGELWISADNTSVGNGDGEVSASGAGRVYVFKQEGARWVLSQTVDGPEPLGLSNFGLSLAVHGDMAVIGSRKGHAEAARCMTQTELAEHGRSRFRRRLHTFQRDAKGRWRLVDTLTHTSENNFAWVGHATALDGRGHLIVAAPDDHDAERLGALSIYRRADRGWRLVRRVSNPMGEGQFATRLAVMKGHVLVGWASGKAHEVHRVGAFRVKGLLGQ